MNCMGASDLVAGGAYTKQVHQRKTMGTTSLRVLDYLRVACTWYSEHY